MMDLQEAGHRLVGSSEVGNPVLDVAVLEDDVLDAELLCRELDRAWGSGVRVSVFAALREFEDALRLSSPDVVFCDLRLPDAEGIEVVRRVVDSAGLAPVVVLSGNNDPNLPVMALRSGAQDYLDKDGLGTGSLARALRYALARSFADGEIRKVVAELREANGELDQYAGMVAHDLRAPIRTARLFTDRLKAAIITGTDPIALASCLESSLERVEAMIERLLRLTTLPRDPLALETISLSEVIEAIGVSILADLESAGATLRVDGDGTLVADPILLQELILNLVHNSLRYAHPDRAPEIVFSLSRTETGSELVVADNGIGIEPGHRDRVFELFERLDPSDPNGLGYGLAFCRRVAELHGGSVSIIDPPSGVGAGFRLCLPS